MKRCIIRKTFEINVRASMNGTETDEFIINSLGKITSQDYDDIRYDLNLPQVAGITWTSSNTSIITNDGKLVENAVVTTATPVTITAASNNVTKAYNLVVSPRTAQVDIATGTAPLAVTLGNVSNAKISSDVIANFPINEEVYNKKKKKGRFDCIPNNQLSAKVLMDISY